jgi:hypothetical protein
MSGSVPTHAHRCTGAPVADAIGRIYGEKIVLALKK